MRIENLIFDFDGTLVDSADDVFDCLRQAYQSVLPGQTVDIRPTHIGPPLRGMIENITPGLDPRTITEIMRNFRQLYDNSTYPKTKMRTGISDLLGSLKQLSVRMFIVTNKPKRATRQILNSLGMDYFQEVVTPDFFPGKGVPKEAMIAYLLEHHGLDASRTLMIGDSELDVSTARENCIKTLVVLDGYGDRKLIRDIQPEYQVNQVAELNHFVRELMKNGS